MSHIGNGQRLKGRNKLRPNLPMLSLPISQRMETVTSFDGAGDRSLISSGDTSIVAPHQLRMELLLQCLLRYICKIHTNQEDMQEELFNDICNRLHNFKFISNTFFGETFERRRTYIEQTFTTIFNLSVQHTQGVNSPAMLPNPMNFIPGSISCMSPLRFETEFEYLDFIGRGGFGQVFKVKHRLDGQIYAMKKIKICTDEGSAEMNRKTILEVQTLAELHHPNVVTYKGSWIEPDLPTQQRNNLPPWSSESSSNSEEDSSSSEKSKNYIHEVSNNYSNSIVFEPSESGYAIDGPTTTVSTDFLSVLRELKIEEICVDGVGSETDVEVVTGIAMERRDSFDVVDGLPPKVRRDDRKNKISEVKEVVRMYHAEGSHVFNAPMMGCRAFLYIQMELCDSTLDQWMKHQVNIDINSVDTIFKHILEGVKEIHRKEVVHRDLKPSNIFYNESNKDIKIGDFGLACYISEHTSLDKSFGAKRRGRGMSNVGTKPYASPEQQTGKVITVKSDMYSVGVVLLELLHRFITKMELVKVLQVMKDNKHIGVIEDKWPREVSLARKLTSLNPIDRPTAEEALEIWTELHVPTLNAFIDMKSQIAQKDKEIAELKAELQAKELYITEMHLRLCSHNGINNNYLY